MFAVVVEWIEMFLLLRMLREVYNKLNIGFERTTMSISIILDFERTFWHASSWHE